MASSGEAVVINVMASGSDIPITSVHDDQASSGDVYT